MSRIPGSSPITPDIEDVRHSEESDAFGDGAGPGSREPEPRDGGAAPTPGEPDENDEIDALAAASVEGRLAMDAGAPQDHGPA